MLLDTKVRLAIISTHPIQYYAPVFLLISQRTRAKVFYTKPATFDKGFQRFVQWDIPLLEGYEYVFAHKNLLEAVKAFQPDYILIYGWAHIRHLQVMRSFSGKIPILFRGDSNLLRDQSVLKCICKKFALTYIYKHIDKALYVGKNNKAYFRQYGLRKKQLVFAPHAIDNSRFSPGVKSDIRNDLELSVDDILVLFAGKFDPIKNPVMLLNAFLELRLANVHLLFVGDGFLKNKLVALSSHSKKVHFLGFQNQRAMPAIYQACDLFCLPSVSESWGLSVNEAMAAGKAVLVSERVGAAADLVREENGRVFKHDNIDDLKSKLREMASSASKLRAYGKASLKIIAAWSFEAQASNILDTIRE